MRRALWAVRTMAGAAADGLAATAGAVAGLTAGIVAALDRLPTRLLTRGKTDHDGPALA